MNINEAIEYARKNHEHLESTKSCIVGVAYTPTDGEASFYMITISLNEEDKNEEGIEFFDVLIEGGDIPDRRVGIEDSIGNDDIKELLNELPVFAIDLNYQVYNGIDGSYHWTQSAYALKKLFPELPDPDSFDLSYFKSEAIALITHMNKSEK